MANTLEISYIGSACGKNRYEPRNKTIFLMLCRKNPKKYLELLKITGVITDLEDNIGLEKPVQDSYKKFKSQVNDPKEFNKIETEVINDIKVKNPNITEPEIQTAREMISSSLKKDCGKNVEETVISRENYTKGNNRMWYYRIKNWTLKGLHDASSGDMVVEIKTRMSLQNVRKNEYDLYQLFGYILVMGKTKGVITQTFRNVIYKSDIETEREFGIVNIETDYWKAKFDKFQEELHKFFKDVDNHYENNDFDISTVFKEEFCPYAQVDQNGKFHNIKSEFTNVFKALS